jgi:hypothetical protein
VCADQRIIAEHNVFSVDFLQCDAKPHIDAARLQDPLRCGAELLTNFGHHLFGEVQQYEIHVGRVEVHLFGGRIGKRPQLHGKFGARIRRADDHDRSARRCPAGIVVHIGQLELLQHVVAQVQRLRRRLQPAGMLRRDRERRKAVSPIPVSGPGDPKTRCVRVLRGR